ncbi:hypothetical protein PV11_06645 [Exophiala sideris]|uniref:Uncharacterized protein n=1 Tax=Exophiala sideris TaxID=1016849 RepID=A0A0D1Y886_9EURO|nr:hypothetical protein PV11_06645 [Exophiala sideris]
MDTPFESLVTLRASHLHSILWHDQLLLRMGKTYRRPRSQILILQVYLLPGVSAVVSRDHRISQIRWAPGRCYHPLSSTFSAANRGLARAGVVHANRTIYVAQNCGGWIGHQALYGNLRVLRSIRLSHRVYVLCTFGHFDVAQLCYAFRPEWRATPLDVLLARAKRASLEHEMAAVPRRTQQSRTSSR